MTTLKVQYTNCLENTFSAFRMLQNSENCNTVTSAATSVLSKRQWLQCLPCPESSLNPLQLESPRFRNKVDDQGKVSTSLKLTLPSSSSSPWPLCFLALVTTSYYLVDEFSRLVSLIDDILLMSSFSNTISARIGNYSLAVSCLCYRPSIIVKSV